jgi:hypothetical protein
MTTIVNSVEEAMHMVKNVIDKFPRRISVTVRPGMGFLSALRKFATESGKNLLEIRVVHLSMDEMDGIIEQINYSIDSGTEAIVVFDEMDRLPESMVAEFNEKIKKISPYRTVIFRTVEA